jgi:hypothetical protein
MFSQQTKRINLQNLQNFQNIPNPYPQYQNSYSSGLIQALQPNTSIYSDFQIPCGMNDNFSLYSSNSTNTTMTNQKKRNITEDINTALNYCLEEFLPKVAEECAEEVYTKISLELQRQTEEIEELKLQLESLRSYLSKPSIANYGNKNSPR